MKEKAVIFECSADAIIDIRKRLDEIASVTNGNIWFETIGQNSINGNGPSLTKYSIICHYPESQIEIRDKYYEDKVRNIQNTFKIELDSVRKENEELKKRLKSAEQSERVDTLSKKCNKFDEDIKEIKDKLDKHIKNCKTINNMHQHSIGIVDSMKSLDIIDINNRLSDLGSEVHDYIDDYSEFRCKLVNRIKALENSVSDIRSIVNSSDIKNISIKAMNDRMNLFAKELDTLSDKLDDYKDAYSGLVNANYGLERRIKAIEKRLSIKPFYEPTEDEKDD